MRLVPLIRDTSRRNASSCTLINPLGKLHDNHARERADEIKSKSSRKVRSLIDRN